MTSETSDTTPVGASPQLIPTPINRAFYEGVTAALPDQHVKTVHELDGFSGLSLELDAGDLLTLTLLDGPQIVNLFAFNRDDPDERIWNEGILREGIFIKRYTRLWGTMARYRPLLTVVEDTVSSDPRTHFGQHHLYLGGSGTPGDWHFAGGPRGVRTTWEQFAGLMEERSLSPALLRENVSLFQKSTVESFSQRIMVLPSDAVRGDRVALFSEINLCVLLALSPYVDGSRPASTEGHPRPGRVEARVGSSMMEPLPWPYPEVPYPDLSLYHDENGRRSHTLEPTAGIDYELKSRSKDEANR